jgi:hypothetical protein
MKSWIPVCNGDKLHVVVVEAEEDSIENSM